MMDVRSLANMVSLTIDPFRLSPGFSCRSQSDI